MGHGDDDFLYVAKECIVQSGCEREFILFMNKLNEYLKYKYSQYYKTLQLYEDRDKKNVFYILSCYYNVDGVYEAYDVINADIDSFYDRHWSPSIRKRVLFSFETSKRVIPPSCI